MKVKLPQPFRKSPISFASSSEVQKHHTSRRTQQAAAFLANYYAWIIFGLGLLMIAMHTLEHLAPFRPSNFFFYLEVFITIILLGTILYLIRMLLALLRERSQAIEILGRKHDLEMQLSTSHDLDQLSNQLVEQVAQIVPDTGVQLFVNEKSENLLIPISDRLENGPIARNKTPFPHGIDLAICQACLAQNNNAATQLRLCQYAGDPSHPQNLSSYCLPLGDQIYPVGMLHLYAPLKRELSDEQKYILENTALEMSTALSAVLEKKAREEAVLTQKVRSLQLDIARDLHDTLGQNISFLRMKLDYLADQDIKNRPVTPDEIQTMYEAANESYDLVRGTLAVLQSNGSVDLELLFNRFATQIAERTNINIAFANRGKPHTLSPTQMRQLFFIFREALSNVEKHSGASQVCVETTWEEDRLKLSISDNGHGFKPSLVDQNHHYGLKFMRERTEYINGTLTIQSEIQMGTQVSVSIPYE